MEADHRYSGHRSALGARGGNPPLPGSPAGRRITHHAIGYLLQKEPKTANSPTLDDDPLTIIAGGGILMEWAIGKKYDIYRPNTGKLLLPGSNIWWELTSRGGRSDYGPRGIAPFTFIPRARCPNTGRT